MLCLPDILNNNISEVLKVKEIKQMIINLDILPNYLQNEPNN